MQDSLDLSALQAQAQLNRKKIKRLTNRWAWMAAFAGSLSVCLFSALPTFLLLLFSDIKSTSEIPMKDTWKVISPLAENIAIAIIILTLILYFSFKERTKKIATWHVILSNFREKGFFSAPLTIWQRFKFYIAPFFWWLFFTGLLGCLLVVCLILAEWIFISLIVLIVGILILFIIAFHPELITYWAYHAPLKKLTFQRAFQRLSWLKQWYSHQWLVKGLLFNIAYWSHARDLDQLLTYSDVAIQQAKQDIKLEILPELMANKNLLLVLKEEAPAALQNLEMLLQTIPHESILYNLLAQYYLEQNLAPARAFELNQITLDHLIPRYKPLEPNILASQALALVRSGDPTQAEKIIGEVIEQLETKPPLHPAWKANPYRLAGLTYLELGDTHLAKHYLQKAIELTPNGVAGILAEQTLARLEGNHLTTST